MWRWVLLAVLCLLVLATVFGCIDGLHSMLPPGLTPIAHQREVLVFHAPWCQFCPREEEIRQLQIDFPDYIVIDANIDDKPEVAKRYGVSRIPAFIVQEPPEDGKVIVVLYRTTSMSDLKLWLTRHKP